MEIIPEVDGACGEIEIMLMESSGFNVPLRLIEKALVYSQYAEYKLSHYLNKAAESVFGFVSELQSTFSIFRWDSIKDRPINALSNASKNYIDDRSKIVSCQNANMYLADYRILCQEIILNKRNSC